MVGGLPTVSFIGKYSRNNQPATLGLGQPPFPATGRDWYFGVQIQVPLFEGFSRVYRARVAHAQVTALRFAFPISRGDGPVSPVTALAAVPAQLLATPCFNSYEFGGYLIFRHVKPFIDGRADMYGDPYMFAYLKAMRPDRATLEALLKRYQIRWALLATDSAAAELIATLPNWRRIHVDAVAVTLVRNDS
ncbi:TolC family protein [Burkholderia ubonensis]|uniref:TolC family protein n=1 Tax=Burkholderia ubonensis TaxID=101571 RepID=UPI000A9ED204